jgi:flagellar protein FliS
MNSYKDAASAYLENTVMTASPVKLVKLLYEGTLRHMEVARSQLSSPETRTSARAGEALGKALAILGELRGTLDLTQGNIVATDLDRLYEFTIHSISEANIKRDPVPLEGGIKVMRTVKEAWDELSRT